MNYIEYTDKETSLYKNVCLSFCQYITSILPLHEIRLVQNEAKKVIEFLDKLENQLLNKDLEDSALFFIEYSTNTNSISIPYAIRSYFKASKGIKSVPVHNFLKDQIPTFKKEEKELTSNNLAGKVLSECFDNERLINDDMALGNISAYWKNDFSPPKNGLTADFENYLRQLEDISMFVNGINEYDSDMETIKYLEDQTDVYIECFCEYFLEEITILN